MRPTTREQNNLAKYIHQELLLDELLDSASAKRAARNKARRELTARLHKSKPWRQTGSMDAPAGRPHDYADLPGQHGKRNWFLARP
jgi:hypothetical protein